VRALVVLLGLAAVLGAAAAVFERVGPDALVGEPAPPATSIGVYRPATGEFFGRRGSPESQTAQDAAFAFVYGEGGDVPVIGDWDGNGSQTQGVFRDGSWILSDTLGNPFGEDQRTFGQAGDRPLVGDWNGDGADTIGVRRGDQFILSDSNAVPAANHQVTFGPVAGVPVAGDWDGDGDDTIGVYEAGTWYLRNSNTPGPPDVTVRFGSDADLPVVGDWDADGRVSVGYFRRGAWRLSNRIAEPSVDVEAFWGGPEDQPLVGNWSRVAAFAPARRSDDTRGPLSRFFPIAVDYQPSSLFGTWKRRGINTVIRVPPNEDVESWTSAANAHGLKMIRAARPDAARDDAEPNLLAFTGPDEPEIAGHAPAAITDEYTRLKRSAPSKPYLINLAGASVLAGTPPADGVSCQGAGISSADTACLDRYIDSADWISHDIYPVNTHQPIATIGATLDLLRQRSGTRPQFAYIEATDLWSDGVVASADQFRGEIWHAIIHGARGISYFVVDVPAPTAKPDAVPPHLVDEMTVQNERITQLAPVLQAPIDPPGVGVTVAAPLEATWRQAGGKTYLVVLNQSDGPVADARIDVLGARLPLAVSAWEEDRALRTSANGFADSFDPYEVHVYEF
jgi:hypothetical protein